MQVALVNVGGNYIGVFPAQHFIGKLPPDLMGLLRRVFSPVQRLVSGDEPDCSLLVRLIQQHLKFYIRRFIGTAIGRNEQHFSSVLSGFSM